MKLLRSSTTVPLHRRLLLAGTAILLFVGLVAAVSAWLDLGPDSDLADAAPARACAADADAGADGDCAPGSTVATLAPRPSPYPPARTPAYYLLEAPVPGCETGSIARCHNNPAETHVWCAVSIDMSRLEAPAGRPGSTVYVDVAGDPRTLDLTHGQLYAFNGRLLPEIPLEGPLPAANLDPAGNPGWLAEARYGSLLQDDHTANTRRFNYPFGKTVVVDDPIGWFGAGSNGLLTGCEGTVQLWDSSSAKPFVELGFSINGLRSVDGGFACRAVDVPGVVCEATKLPGNGTTPELRFTISGRPQV